MQIQDSDLSDDLTSYNRGVTEIYEPKKRRNPKDYIECSNKNNHNGFIPISELTLAHIPERCNGLLDFVKVTSDLTVRINAKMTMREIKDDEVRTGSGMIVRVRKYIDDETAPQCPCLKCQIADQPETAKGAVWISTSSKLIENNYEAKNATFRLYYDSESSPFQIIDGYDIVREKLNENEVEVRCLTCDESLLDDLSENLKKWDNLKKKHVTNKKLQKLRFVIAHPHGCAKQVYLLDDKKVSGKIKGGKQSHETCPGSNGAYVLTVNTKSLWQ